MRLARRVISGSGLILAGATLALAAATHSAALAVASLGMASFFNDLAMAGGWSACMDVGGRHAGSLSGSMNMMGNFGGAVQAVVTGYILGDATSLHSLQAWMFALLIAAGLYVMGAMSWLFIDPVTPLDDEPEGSAVLPIETPDVQ